MAFLDLFFAVSPLLVIFLILIVWGKPAHIGGVVALVSTFIISCFYFHTDIWVALGSAASGAISSLPITMVLVVAMLQVSIMAETGAIRRISVFFKSFAVNDTPSQVLFLSCTVPTVLTSLGAVPITVLPPLLRALGFSTTKAIALPCMGYAATCTYSLMAVPLDILTRFLGCDLDQVALLISQYMFLANAALAMGCLWVAGGKKMVLDGIIPALLMGLGCWAGGWICAKASLVPITGVVIGAILMLLTALYLRLKGRVVYDRTCLNPDDLAEEQRMPLWRALSTWICLVLGMIVVNVPASPAHTFLHQPMLVEIVPGKPENLRLFSQTYVWLFFFTIICTPLMRPKHGVVTASIKKWLGRVYRPTIAALSFFALAYLFNHSGKDATWSLISPGHNMMLISAGSVAGAVGSMYVAVAPYISLIAGLLTGSQAAIIAMLSNMHLEAGNMVGVNAVNVALSGAMGAGVASMVSPMKILNAASTLDSPQSGGAIMRKMLGLSLLITLVVSLNCILLNFISTL